MPNFTQGGRDVNALDHLMKEAEKEIKELKTNEEFVLKDLFKGYEWNRIPVKERTSLGALFSEYSATKHSHVQIVEGTAGQTKYKKV